VKDVDVPTSEIPLSLPEPRDLRLTIFRTLLGHCPNCGVGNLMASYLKQVDRCSHCGESFGLIRADDAPPWLTILVVGHIVVPLALMVERNPPWPNWIAMLIWPAIAAALGLAILPRAKALFIGIIWSTRAPGIN
jgi:uncharacterized protein (DUF983 family)